MMSLNTNMEDKTLMNCLYQDMLQLLYFGYIYVCMCVDLLFNILRRVDKLCLSHIVVI